MLGLLVAGLLVVAGPWSGSPAEAGKKHRDGSLDSLRERNVSERWSRLQKLFRPLRDDEENGPDPSVPPALPVNPSRTELDNHPSEIPGEEGARPPANNGSANGSPSELKIVEGGNTLRDESLDPSTSPPSSGVGPQPVWFLGDDVGRPALEPNDAASPPSETPAAEAADRESRLQMQSIGDARPKPITSILPYYDYAPEGSSPCEILCPRPEGCPDNSAAKPCPAMVDLPDVPLEGREFVATHVTWEPSNLFSNPLYFEDAALERYGHTHNDLLQPFVSVGKFGVQLVGLPYQMALHPVHEHRYALGWYRPGECAPYKYYLPPWNTKAALTAGAVYTGLFYVVP